MKATLPVVVLGGSLVIAAACGGGGGGGGPKAPTSTTVTIEYPSPANPGERFALVIDDSSGVLVSSSFVSSGGSQTVTVPANGSVFFAAALDSSFSYSGAVAPPDGTTLHMAEPWPLETPTPSPSQIETWNVALTGAPASATAVTVWGPCGSAITGNVAGPVTVDTYSCPAPVAKTKLLAVAFDSSQRIVGWGISPEQTFSPGTTVSLSIALDQTDLVRMTDMFQSIPDETFYLTSALSLRNPYWFQQPLFSGGEAWQAGSPSQPIFIDVPAVESSAMLVEFNYANVGYFIHQRPLASVPGSVTFDMTGLSVPTFPAFDAPTGTFSWIIQPDFGQGVIFHGSVYSSFDPTQVMIEVAMEPGAQEYRLPQFPSSMLPQTSLEQLTGSGYAAEIDFASQPTYQQFLDGIDFPDYFSLPNEEVTELVAQQPI